MTSDDKIVWKSLIPVIANVGTNCLQLAILTIGWKLAKSSGMNQGVVTTLLSVASLTNIAIFYCLFREKVSPLQFIGVIVMIAAVSCITIAAASEKEPEDFDTNDTMGLSKISAALLAILCGFLGALCMSTKHVFIRKYKANYSGFDMGLDTCILEFFAYQFFLIPLYNSEDFTIGWEEIGLGCVAGLFIATGRIAIAVAVSIGLAGPA